MNPADAPRQTALITGASTGIGLELARCFARGGFDVVLTARRREPLETLAAECRQAGGAGVRAEVIVADLAEPAAPQAIADALAALGMNVDVLVNNAGFGTHGPFVRTNLEREIAMVQVNAVALLALTRLLVPPMVQRRRGRVLNVASLAGFTPGPLMSTYFATKAFVVSHSRALRAELSRKGVTVTLLCPGPVETEFHQRAGIRGTSSGLGAITAAHCARAGYEGCLRGRALVVPGVRAWLAFQALRFVPAALAAAAVMWRNRARG